jgi:hypothetical protein
VERVHVPGVDGIRIVFVCLWFGLVSLFSVWVRGFLGLETELSV